MAKNYSNPDYALVVAELIGKYRQFAKVEERTTRDTVTESTIRATHNFFVHSSKNWFESVISLDKPFRRN